MATYLERYEILKRHMAEEAARVIAEALPLAEQVVTKDYLDARLGQLEASMHRWMLTFMGSLFLGVGAMIVAIVLKG